jgi:hypothetical protein
MFYELEYCIEFDKEKADVIKPELERLAIDMYHYLQALQTKLKRELAGLDKPANKD